MKRAFLVPTAVAISALSQAAEANTPVSEHNQAVGDAAQSMRRDESQAAVRATIETSKRPITNYAVEDQLFGFVIERNESGQVVAQHYSHSSHASHASHASHYSSG